MRCKDAAETEMMGHKAGKPKIACGSQELEEAGRRDSSPEPPEGGWLC